MMKERRVYACVIGGSEKRGEEKGRDIWESENVKKKKMKNEVPSF